MYHWHHYYHHHYQDNSQVSVVQDVYFLYYLFSIQTFMLGGSTRMGSSGWSPSSWRLWEACLSQIRIRLFFHMERYYCSLTHSLTLSLSLSLSLDRKPALKVHSNSPREILRCKKYQNSHGWRRPTWRSLQCESLSPLSSVTAPETPAYPCGHQQRCFPPGGRGGGSYWAWWDDITVTTTEEEEKSF